MRELDRAFFTRVEVDADEVSGAEVTDNFAVFITDVVVARATGGQKPSNPAADPWEGTDVRGSKRFLLVPRTGFEPVLPA